MRHTERTKTLLESNEWKTWTVERRVPTKGNFRITKSIDLFNIIDMLAIRPGKTMGVQVCGTDFQPHIKKIMHEYNSNTVDWLEAGNDLVLIGWRKIKKRKKDGSYSKVYKYAHRWATFVLNGKLECIEKMTEE